MAPKMYGDFKAMQRGEGTPPYGMHAAVSGETRRDVGIPPYGVHATVPGEARRGEGTPPYGIHVAVSGDARRGRGGGIVSLLMTQQSLSQLR